MARCICGLAALFWIFGCVELAARADAPIGFSEVVAVKPSRLIDHEVDVQGPFDEAAVETFLVGPQFFSHAVGVGQETVRTREAYLNWYQITRPTREPRRTVRVRDSLRGETTHTVTVENSAYLLAPAQKLSSGPPSQIPDGLGYFKLYKIVDAQENRQTIRLRDAFVSEERTLTRAAFLGLPAAQSHHDEHTPARHLETCVLIYELEPANCEASVTTIDQFGLNTLRISSSTWLAVPAVVEKAETSPPR